MKSKPVMVTVVALVLILPSEIKQREGAGRAVFNEDF